MHGRGANFDPDTRAVVLYLDKAQYAVFEKAVLTTGATKHPRGLLNKEDALTKFLSANLSSCTATGSSAVRAAVAGMEMERHIPTRPLAASTVQARASHFRITA